MPLTEGFPILGTAAFVISFLGLGTSFLALFSAAPRLIYSLAEQKSYQAILLMYIQSMVRLVVLSS